MPHCSTDVSTVNMINYFFNTKINELVVSSCGRGDGGTVLRGEREPRRRSSHTVALSSSVASRFTGFGGVKFCLHCAPNLLYVSNYTI